MTKKTTYFLLFCGFCCLLCAVFCVSNKHCVAHPPFENDDQQLAAVSRHEIESLFDDIKFEQYVVDPKQIDKTNIVPEDKHLMHPKTHKTKPFTRPEERGEDFTLLEDARLLDKLTGGDRIEQRKAANALWQRFGKNASSLPEEARQVLYLSTERYLAGIKSDFEENFLQIQRLWHLAVPALLANVTNEDVSVSENSARLLSVMKTPQIIERLLADASKAKAREDVNKYIFALEYLKINNPYFLENRHRMSDLECAALYRERVVPQIQILRQRLQAEK